MSDKTEWPPSAPTSDFEAAMIRCLAHVPRRWSLEIKMNGHGSVSAAVIPPFLPYEEWFEELREVHGDTFTETIVALADLLDRRPPPEPTP